MGTCIIVGAVKLNLFSRSRVDISHGVNEIGVCIIELVDKVEWSDKIESYKY